MPTVVGIDWETTGLVPAEDRIIEVGCCLYDWNTGIPLKLVSDFVNPERPIPEEITKITGVTSQMVEEHGRTEQDVISEVTYYIDIADYVMAHNSKFDRGFYDAAAARYGTTRSKPWICSLEDIKYPEQIKTRNLKHLAAEHNFLPGFSHRAVFDVLTMLKIASNYDLDAIIARSKEPMVYVQAHVTYNENQKAKDFSFRWNAKGKIWWKEMKVSDMAAEKDKYEFKFTYLNGRPEE